MFDDFWAITAITAESVTSNSPYILDEVGVFDSIVKCFFQDMHTNFYLNRFIFDRHRAKISWHVFRHGVYWCRSSRLGTSDPNQLKCSDYGKLWTGLEITAATYRYGVPGYHDGLDRVVSAYSNQLVFQFLQRVILSVRLFLRPTVTLVLCDKMKKHTADSLIPYEKIITLVFWHQEMLMADVPFHLKFAVKVAHPLSKTPTSTNICL